MDKTVRNAKNSLKFKAQPRPGIVSVRLGGKKYVLPIEARVLKSDDFVFLSLPACSELFEVKNGQLSPLAAEADATAAYAALNPRPNGRHRVKPALPVQLAEALKSVPPNFKIGYDSTGAPKLVRRRQRSRR